MEYSTSFFFAAENQKYLKQKNVFNCEPQPTTNVIQQNKTWSKFSSVELAAWTSGIFYALWQHWLTYTRKLGPYNVYGLSH
jgi:hypothetical protein